MDPTVLENGLVFKNQESTQYQILYSIKKDFIAKFAERFQHHF